MLVYRIEDGCGIGPYTSNDCGNARHSSWFRGPDTEELCKFLRTKPKRDKVFGMETLSDLLSVFTTDNITMVPVSIYEVPKRYVKVLYHYYGTSRQIVFYRPRAVLVDRMHLPASAFRSHLMDECPRHLCRGS